MMMRTAYLKVQNHMVSLHSLGIFVPGKPLCAILLYFNYILFIVKRGNTWLFYIHADEKCINCSFNKDLL